MLATTSCLVHLLIIVCCLYALYYLTSWRVIRRLDRLWPPAWDLLAICVFGLLLFSSLCLAYITSKMYFLGS